MSHTLSLTVIITKYEPPPFRDTATFYLESIQYCITSYFAQYFLIILFLGVVVWIRSCSWFLAQICTTQFPVLPWIHYPNIKQVTNFTTETLLSLNKVPTWRLWWLWLWKKKKKKHTNSHVSILIHVFDLGPWDLIWKILLILTGHVVSLFIFLFSPSISLSLLCSREIQRSFILSFLWPEQLSAQPSSFIR